MGKRMRKGVRSSPSTSANIKSIARDIDSLGLASSLDADAVASQLRSHFQRSYLRHKLRTLTFSVDKALRFLRTTSNNNNNTPSSVTTSSSSDRDDVEGIPARKRPNRTDPSEQRLLRAESQHIRSRARSNPAPSESSDSDGSTSTSKSEDADFEAKLDPEFDVTSSLLREKYAKLRAVAPAPAREERNVEIEAAVGKKKRTLGSPEKDAAAVKGDAAVGREGPRFRDLGGVKSVIEELMMEVIVPLCHPQLPRWLGVRPMAGILLHGPPGCGKTKLAHAIANETGVPFYKISATEVVSGVSGASEENIRDLFKKAYRTAPSIVFIDEIDAIASKRENLQREMERRIVTQLMTCMDESHQTLRPEDADSESETSDKKPGYVLVIGATNRPDAVDQALRRPGRFDREIALGVPDENGRLEILSVLTKNLRLEGEFDLLKIARSTPGFVGADLAALANKAGNLAMKRIMDRRKSDISQKLNGEKVEDWWRQPWSPEELDSLSMIMADFEEAIKMVQPSSRREGFSSIPSTKWEDVGGLKSLRKEFDRYIVQRIKNPEDYEELGVNMEVGFLLYGPPGCGKTLIAKAVANEAGANFIHIKGPELLNKYVGESELAVRTIFSRARTCSPCIVFFDEVDALTTKRGKEGGWVVERLLNQLLIELDGADQRQGVYVIGATNRLEVMDPAVLRPGRFGRVLYVPLPSAEERGLILKALSQKKPIAADVDLVALGHKEACRNLTGADLTAVMNEAAMAALEEKQMSWDKDSLHIIRPLVIGTSHFEKALGKITPSVSEKERNYYEAMSHRYRTAGVEKLELPSTSSMNCDVLCGQIVP